MTSSSEPELSFEQREVRKVSAKIEAIEGILIAESEQKDLNPTQKQIKTVAVLHGGLSKYLEELQTEKTSLQTGKTLSRLELFTVYLCFSFLCILNISNLIPTQKQLREIIADILKNVSEEDLQKKLSNPHVLVSSSGSEWDYQENGGFKKELCKTFVNNLNEFNSKEYLDKCSSPIPLLVGGIGEGKSRALQEASKMLKKLAEDSKTFSQVLVFQVTFENGTPPDMKLKASEHVPLRILYHLSDQTVDYKQFEASYGNKGLCLGDVLDYLTKDNSKPSAVLLMIDGFHNLAENPIELPRDNPLRTFLQDTVCGDYILGRQRRHFIFPLCSCTASITAIEALRNDKAWIPLPKLTTVPLQNGKQIRITQKQLRVMGENGRAVEVLMNIIANNTKQSMTDIQLYSEVAEELRSNKSGFGGFESDHVTALLKACFLRETLVPERNDTNIPVGEGKELHVSTFTQHGLLRIEKRKLTIAPIWLLINKNQENGHILQGWQGATPVGDVQWEEFGAWFRMFLSRVHEDGGETMGVVHRLNFNDYFGPFAAFWPRNSPSSSFLGHQKPAAMKQKEAPPAKSQLIKRPK